MDESKFINLCTKAVTGNISHDEQHELDFLLESSPKNLEIYNQLHNTWQQTEFSFDSPLPDIEKEWLKFYKKIEVKEEKTINKIVFSQLEKFRAGFAATIQPRLRPAFIVLAALIIFISLIFVLKNRTLEPEFIEIFTVNKQRTTYVFSDGSKVRLNCGSSIKFFKTFSDTTREVHLAGEAFFDVLKDKRPFIVLTENARTTVLGTEFNIWARNNRTRIMVKDGKVRFGLVTNATANVELIKNQMSCVKDDLLPQEPKNVDTDYLLGWLEDKLVFEKTTLIEILNELERTYDMSIELKNGKLENETITAVFDNSPIDTVLSSICLTLGINYEVESGRYILLD